MLTLDPSYLIISDPFWYRLPWADEMGLGAIRVCTLKGVTHSSLNHLDVSPDGARVDASIVGLIAKLNAIGCGTRFCCSGLQADHTAGANPRYRTTTMQAYILFDSYVPSIVRECAPPPLQWEGDRLGVLHRGVEDAELAAAWRTFEERLDALIRAHLSIPANSIDTLHAPS